MVGCQGFASRLTGPTENNGYRMAHACRIYNEDTKFSEGFSQKNGTEKITWEQM
jgi:hypothetical protein